MTDKETKPDDGALDAAMTRDHLPKGSRPWASFTVQSGEHAGKVFEVRDAVILGRESELCPCFEETGVSREHARLWCSAQGAYHIEDLGSTNGTFVNDVRVERRTLVVGDRVRFGPSLVLAFAFRYPSEPPGAGA